ncbi:MAG TPA: hypothetical protein VLG37_04860 [Candidatus Saccharimonadales bacterium]|nr:hypothetical protein [Candidatus Saccharimonadales bacterium]
MKRFLRTQMKVDDVLDKRLRRWHLMVLGITFATFYLVLAFVLEVSPWLTLVLLLGYILVSSSLSSRLYRRQKPDPAKTPSISKKQLVVAAAFVVFASIVTAAVLSVSDSQPFVRPTGNHLAVFDSGASFLAIILLSALSLVPVIFIIYLLVKKYESKHNIRSIPTKKLFK